MHSNRCSGLSLGSSRNSVEILVERVGKTWAPEFSTRFPPIIHTVRRGGEPGTTGLPGGFQHLHKPYYYDVSFFRG